MVRLAIRSFRIALTFIIFLVAIGKYLGMIVREDSLMNLSKYLVLRLLSRLTKSTYRRNIRG